VTDLVERIINLINQEFSILGAANWYGAFKPGPTMYWLRFLC